ncbi:SusC/RagA family TonB-linked outer membrane protein [Bacteroidia bacterium]|nr:SusC/RagA family TonB-linked outer membrane protein [Bacteroidia bacterium]
MTLMSMSVFAQQHSVSGVVLDEATNEPLIGVSVLVKGSNNGAVTNLDGQFDLTGIANNATLVFSYIGYSTKEVAVNNQSKLTVVLAEDNKLLDEVVVVGFGTQKKVNLTGAVGVVNAKDLADRPVQNVAQALQGLITGLNITQTNGSLDDKPSINVRGQGTIGEGSKSDPLILIDGMEGDINALNPQDIESISTLKDAAASSIYGSRAPFGVILITTKRGQQGKAKFNYNNNFRWNSPMTLPKMLDSYKFALYFNDASINGSENPRFDAAYLQRILDYQNGIDTAGIPEAINGTGKWADGYDYGYANTDWYAEIYKKQAFSQEHNVSLTGGSETINYYISGNFLGQDGLMKLNQDIFNRYTASAKVGAKLNDWATVNYSTRFIRQEYERPAALTSGLYHDLARQGWPTLPFRDPNGFLYSSPSPALGLADRGQDKYQKDWLYQQVQVVLEPIKGWKTFAELNYRSENNFNHWDNQITYNHDVEGNPYAYSTSSAVYEGASRTNYYDINIYTEYTKSLNDTHNFKVMGGFQTEQMKYRELSAEKAGIQDPAYPVLNVNSGLDENGLVKAPSANGYYNDWVTAGFFGRINYNYLEKYLLEVNLRYDGNSRFRREHRWDLFPSVSAGWNIARESFWEENLDKLSTFKFRVSYGELGGGNVYTYGDDKNEVLYYPTYLGMPLNQGGGRDWLIGGVRPNTAYSPDPVSSTWTWESINTFNIGLDVAALNNRLTLTADYYVRTTKDQIGPAPTLPKTYGYTEPKTNNTELQTKGWELELGWKDKIGDFSYSATVRLSDYRGKVTKYFNPTGNIWTYYSGKNLGDIWGFETIDLARDEQQMIDHLASLPNGGQDALGTQWVAGDVMYKDLNGNGKISEGAGTLDDHDDLKIIGNDTPHLPFSLDLNASYKGFDFRAFFQGVGKRDYWQRSYYFWGATAGHNTPGGGGLWHSTGFVEHLDYYRPADYSNNDVFGPNVDGYYPNPSFNRSGKNQFQQTRYLQDASYIRLKNLQIGYTLPATITHKFGCSKLRIFASGENLWTATKLATMFDPETISGGWESFGNVYPLSKVFSVGLNVNF